MNGPEALPLRSTSTKSEGAIGFIIFSLVAAATAAAAAFISSSQELPVWAMFVGWVAYFTRVGGWRNTMANFLCVVIGVVLGIGAALAIPLLQPFVGIAALPFVVFVVATIVVSLRAITPINNLLCYFLGLIAFFALHLPPSLSTWLHLAPAIALGFLAAGMSRWLQDLTSKAVR